MGRRLTVLAAVCLVAVATALPWRVVAASTRFLVAVARDDGKLHPFGVVEGDTWTRAWAPVAKTAEVPIRLVDIPSRWLAGVPFSPTWHLHPDDGPPRDVTVTRATWAPSFCRQQVLLETRDGARSELRPPRGPFVPKQGLAVLGEGRVQRAAHHDAASPVLTQLADALAPHVNRAEEWQLRGPYLGVFIHPYSADERRTYPVQVITLDEGPGPDGPVAYFEAVRRYPRERSDPDLAWCDIVTFAAGWTHTRGETPFEVTLTEVAITSCMLDDVARRVPLGIVHAGVRPTWVFEEQHAAGERITVYVPPGRRGEQQLLATPTGFCGE
jgi:hypothetical protein